MRVVDGVKLECVCGDISRQNGIKAVVNAANAQLMPGGGVAGALHRAAGPGLAEECRPLAPIVPGQAVITGGHRLPNEYVIHCLGPVWGVDEPAEQLLINCYRNALRLAEEREIESIAFPAISTGSFGYPFELAMRAALATVIDLAPTLAHVRLVRFMLASDSDAAHCERIVDEFLGNGTST